MESLKQEAIKAISTLPENVDLEEIMYKLYVIDKVRKGESAIKAGKKISSEELKKEIVTWWVLKYQKLATQTSGNFLSIPID